VGLSDYSTEYHHVHGMQSSQAHDLRILRGSFFFFLKYAILSCDFWLQIHVGIQPLPQLFRFNSLLMRAPHGAYHIASRGYWSGPGAMGCGLDYLPTGQITHYKRPVTVYVLIASRCILTLGQS